MSNLPTWLADKWQRLKTGSREVISDQSLDLLSEHFKPAWLLGETAIGSDELRQ